MGPQWIENHPAAVDNPGTHSFHGPNGEIISMKPSPKTHQSWESVVEQE